MRTFKVIKMKKTFTIIFIAFTVLIYGCKKQFLDAKPDDSLVVPASLSDMQNVLDNSGYLNGGKNISGPDPQLLNASGDEYYVPAASYTTLSDYNKAVYTWAKTIPWPSADQNWDRPYRVIFYANTVLDGLKNIHPSTTELVTYNNLKGGALFLRAYQFYNIAELFAPTYNASTAVTDLGIPLRLTADVSVASARSSIQETYDRIISDLTTSVPLLPNKALLQTRPCKAAAFALLGRVYLAMGSYSKALQFCDSALTVNSALLDYNQISPTQSVPFSVLNQEVLFQCSMSAGNGILGGNSSSIRIDTTLIGLYGNNDLRKALFFKASSDKKYIIKGTYSGTSIPFTGIANDEVFLIQAECFARVNNVAAALKSLNALLKYRYAAASFTPVTAIDQADALNKILGERRKELAFRNLRWADLRRLNALGANISLTRNVNGNIYTLAANDIRYTWAIPDAVIGLTGMPQNPR
jgi:tetratricopeptide (TPR) repeat protein